MEKSKYWKGKCVDLRSSRWKLGGGTTANILGFSPYTLLIKSKIVIYCLPLQCSSMLPNFQFVIF